VTQFLIDTNVISELRKGDRANTGVRSWFTENAHADMWLSVLVVGELRRGVDRISRRDEAAGRSIGTWLTQLVETFDDRILGVDLAVALEWGRLGVPDPLAVTDGLLAATALTHNLTIVTRNSRDFEKAGARQINPFRD